MDRLGQGGGRGEDRKLADDIEVIGDPVIGSTEFVVPGVLPEIASGVHVSTTAAGLLVSGYALGVVVGALVAGLSPASGASPGAPARRGPPPAPPWPAPGPTERRAFG